MDRLVFFGFLLLFLYPIFFSIYLYMLGIIFIYLPLSKKLKPKQSILLLISLFLIFPLYYYIALIFHKKVLWDQNLIIKIILSYLLFIFGNFLLFYIFKNDKNEFRQLGIKFLFYGSLGGIFLVGIMVSWIGLLLLGFSFL